MANVKGKKVIRRRREKRRTSRRARSTSVLPSTTPW